MKDAINTTRWFAGFRPNPNARLRLFCFPYAGGGALIYRDWASKLPSTVEVLPIQLPGRGMRLKEAPYTDLSSLVAALADGITPYLDRPFAFFGHSMGAMISFELARKLREGGRSGPAHLFVSGRRAPHIEVSTNITHNLPDDEFIEELRRLSGTPPEVLEHPELMQLMMPTLRADFRICETYEFLPGPPLSCSISAFGGVQDDEAPRDQIEGWQEHTAADFSLSILPGNHFFLHSSEALLMSLLSERLYKIIRNMPL